MLRNPKNENFLTGLEHIYFTPIRVEKSRAGDKIIDSIKQCIEQKSRVGTLSLSNEVPIF